MSAPELVLPERPEQLRLRMSSMQWNDVPSEKRADLRLAVPRAELDVVDDAPDFIAFTELDSSTFRQLVGDYCRRMGYRFTCHRGDALAIHPRHRIVELSFVDVLDRFKPPRGLTEATVDTPAGNRVTVHTAHWVRFAESGMHDQQTRAMVERVQLHGQGNRVALWMGDANVDDNPGTDDRSGMAAEFARGGLVSIYDALGVYPPTQRRATIDLVGSYAPDPRVRALSVSVERPRYSDHDVVDAAYRIKAARRG